MRESRRAFLSTLGTGLVVAAGSVALAGCSSPLGEGSPLGDDDPEPIDVTEAELEEVVAMEVPELESALPVEIDETHLDSFRERAQALLGEIPDDLTAEIPNEAVRTMIDDERESAREDLEASEAADSSFERRQRLASARRDAAEAEAVYAAAVGERDREEVYAEVEPLLDQRAELASALTYHGETPLQAMFVYEEIEGWLSSVDGRLERVDAIAAGAAEVEAVAHAASPVESSRADLETATHLQERQEATGEQPVDEQFEEVASTLLEELSGQAEALPMETGDVDELFDATVENTPREEIGHRLLLSGRRPDQIRERLDDGRLATALVWLYDLALVLEAIERMQARVDDGGFERPTDTEPVGEAKADVIAAFEASLDDPEHPWLTRHGLDIALNYVDVGDYMIERDSTERATVQSLGNYAVAGELARAVPDVNEWFVEAF